MAANPIQARFGSLLPFSEDKSILQVIDPSFFLLMRPFSLLLLCGMLVLGLPSVLLAQVNEEATEEGDVFADEGIVESDVEVELEAEVLPDQPLRFGLENAWYRIRRAFAFQAERKAELDRSRLHALDRKMAACAEIGDQQCIARLEEKTEQTEQRAKQWLERKQEVLEGFQTRFEAWRELRHERIDQWKVRAALRETEQDELRSQFREKREEIQNQRKQRLEVENRNKRTRENVREHLEEQEKRLQPSRSVPSEEQSPVESPAEVLIEARSQRVKQQLDTTRQQVQTRQRAADTAISE